MRWLNTERGRIFFAGFIAFMIAAILFVPRATPTEDPFATDGEWNQMELLHNIEGGRVLQIGARSHGGTLLDPWDGEQLEIYALTDENQTVKITNITVPSDILRLVFAYGADELLSEEAMTALKADSSGRIYGPRPLGIPLSLWSTLFSVFMFGLAAGLVFWLIKYTPIGRGFRSSKVGQRHDGDVNAETGVSWDDVAGCEEAKLELSEVVAFLDHADRFALLGATVPRGVLLWGPPGTGKTMLARAVAGEAGVRLFTASGSEFLDTYVGVGPRRVRDLFKQARKAGGGVIFIDELDAIAGTRGGAGRIGTEERDQTLNQILIELDGMERNAGIVVIGATNRIDTLDPAIMRPGRLGRKVHVGYPDRNGRRAILAVHAKGKPLENEKDLDDIARRTGRMTGAQLADLLNESAILAGRRERATIGMRELTDALLKVQVGPSRQRSMNERERTIIAAHEAGHALAGRLSGSPRKVEEISLYAHGEALGVTIYSAEDHDLPSEADLRAMLVGIMGGRAGEDLCFTSQTPGASHDYLAATELARTMVVHWGFGHDPQDPTSGPSRRGALGFLAGDKDGIMPDGVEDAVTRAINALLDEAYEEARRLLLLHLGLLWAVGEELTREERMGGERLDEIIARGAPAPDGDTPDWRSPEAAPRAWREVLAERAASGA